MKEGKESVRVRFFSEQIFPQLRDVETPLTGSQDQMQEIVHTSSGVALAISIAFSYSAWKEEGN